MTEITTQQEFNAAKGLTGNRLFLFFGDGSDRNRLDQYEEAALRVAVNRGKLLHVFSVNIDHTILADTDVQKFQDGINVICVTAVDANGSVTEKAIEPSPQDVGDMVSNLLF